MAGPCADSLPRLEPDGHHDQTGPGWLFDRSTRARRDTAPLGDGRIAALRSEQGQP